MYKKSLYWFFSIIILSLDLSSKILVILFLEPYTLHPVIKNFFVFFFNI